MSKEDKFFTLKELYFKNDCKPFWAKREEEDKTIYLYIVAISPLHYALGWNEDGYIDDRPANYDTDWSFCSDPTAPKRAEMRVWMNGCGEIHLGADDESDSWRDCTAELAEALAPYLKEIYER